MFYLEGRIILTDSQGFARITLGNFHKIKASMPDAYKYFISLVVYYNCFHYCINISIKYDENEIQNIQY